MQPPNKDQQPSNEERPWETVIGLEVHTELLTRTKLFCGCRNAFGEEPNTNVCPVCLALPGSLPVLNEAAVDLAARIGIALNAAVQRSIFHRKNYFYPDMPKAFQISQYDEPICIDGHLDLPDGSRVGIERAHLEEDTGKTTHMGGSGRIHGSERSLVDYNRAGVPLVEIVSKPDMRTAEQARAYVSELRSILVMIGSSDGRMEEGSLRVDANVSVRRMGDEKLGTRCEIKNLNSLRSLGRAIEYEAGRQIALLESSQPVVQQTRHWNENDGLTVAMRSKEEAFDYRYFPEPDLVPVVPDAGLEDRIRSQMPLLPAARRDRLSAMLIASEESSSSLLGQVNTVVELGLDDLVVGAVSCGAPLRLAIARAANEAASSPEHARLLSPEAFATLLTMEANGRLGAGQTKSVLAVMLERIPSNAAMDPESIATECGFGEADPHALDALVEKVSQSHPNEWERFVEGDGKVAGYLMGQVMRLSGGKVDGKAVRAALEARLGAR